MATSASNAVASAVGAVKRAAASVGVNTFGVDAFTTSGASGLYNRARPSYPPEAVQKLLSAVRDGQPAHIVEVGAGTGIFTSNLVNAPNAASKIGKITAVEPSSGMRQSFQSNKGIHESQTVANGTTKVEIVDGAFAEIPVPDATVDIVVGAQCYHWAEPHYAATMREFARVLKPGGTLAFIWNLEDRKKARWVGQIRDAYEAYEHGTPQYRLRWWEKAYDTDEYKSNFQPREDSFYQVMHPTTEQGVVDRIWSKSYITAQPKEEQDKIADNVRAVLKEGGGKVWIDEANGVFEYPYETELIMSLRK